MTPSITDAQVEAAAQSFAASASTQPWATLGDHTRDRFRVIARAALEAAQMAAWQPIETAPNEGSYLVSYLGQVTGQRFIAQIDRAIGPIPIGPICEPTHWMPLPQLPPPPEPSP